MKNEFLQNEIDENTINTTRIIENQICDLIRSRDIMIDFFEYAIDNDCDMIVYNIQKLIDDKQQQIEFDMIDDNE